MSRLEEAIQRKKEREQAQAQQREVDSGKYPKLAAALARRNARNPENLDPNSRLYAAIQRRNARLQSAQTAPETKNDTPWFQQGANLAGQLKGEQSKWFSRQPGKQYDNDPRLQGALLDAIPKYAADIAPEYDRQYSEYERLLGAVSGADSALENIIRVHGGVYLEDGSLEFPTQEGVDAYNRMFQYRQRTADLLQQAGQKESEAGKKLQQAGENYAAAQRNFSEWMAHEKVYGSSETSDKNDRALYRKYASFADQTTADHAAAIEEIIGKLEKADEEAMSPQEAEQLWNELGQRVNYLMYSGNWGTSEMEAVADKVYQTRNRWNQKYRQNLGVSDDDIYEQGMHEAGRAAGLISHKKDFLLEANYLDGGIVPEKIPYQNNETLLNRFRYRDSEYRDYSDETTINQTWALGEYLANVKMTQEECNAFIAAVDELAANGAMSKEDADYLKETRDSNGLGANQNGMERAMEFAYDHWYKAANLGDALEVGSENARDFIFLTAPGAVDQTLTRGAGYIVEGAGHLVSLLSDDAGDKVKNLGHAMENAESRYLKEGQTLTDYRNRKFSKKLEHNGEAGRWILEKVPGITQSLLQMGVASGVAGSAMAASPGMSLFAGGAAKAASPLSPQLSAATRVFASAAKHSSNLVMSGFAAVGGYAASLDKEFSPGERVFYALGQGAIEFSTNLLFGGNPLLDAGDAGLFTKAIYASFKNETLRKIVSSAAVDWLGEGFEEVAASLGTYALDYAMTGHGALTGEQLADDFIVGVFTSTIMLGGNKVAEVFYDKAAAAKAGKITKFDVSNLSELNDQMTVYVIDCLGGDVEMMKKAGWSDEKIYIALNKWERIVQEYSVLLERFRANPARVMEQAEMDAQESTQVNDDPATHTAEEMQRIEEYKSAVDPKLVEFVEESKTGGKANDLYALETVNEKAAADIKNITGIDVTGFRTAIERRQVWHILKRHGANGRANQSMSDVNDIARIQYILNNYDTVTPGGTSSSYTTVKENGHTAQAQVVLFSKKIDGTYYVAEAVPNTKRRTLFVTSAFIDQNGQKETGTSQPVNAQKSPVETPEASSVSVPDDSGFTQARNAQSPANTPEASLASQPSAMGSITQPAGAVNEKSGGNNYESAEIFDDGGQRNAGVGTGGQAGTVAESAGGSVSRSQARAEAAVLSNLARNAQAQSPREIGVEDGSSEQSLYVLSDGDISQSERWTKVKEDAEADGARVVFFAGDLKVYNRATKGYSKVEGIHQTDSDGNTVYYIKADKLSRNAEQIYVHEKFHDIVRRNPGLPPKLMTVLEERYGQQEIAALVNSYAEAYDGIYGRFDESMTADEQQELVSLYMEEVFADVYAGIKRGARSTASAKKVMESQTDEIQRAAQNKKATGNKTAPPAQKYLFAGEKARTADLHSLEEAKQMSELGAEMEDIRKATGWHQGKDGKWRFEIDDSNLEFRREGDVRLLENEGYRRLQELTEKWAASFESGRGLTDSETAEMEALEEEYSDRVWAEKYMLRDFLKHDVLFEAYPRLKGVSLIFDSLESGENGYFSRRSNTIVLSDRLLGSPESTLIHEIQHVIQRYEDFSTGSSPEYWNKRMEAGFSKRWNTGEEMMPTELYRNTAGEIEARDSAERRHLSADERKKTSPVYGDENTVFVENEVGWMSPKDADVNTTSIKEQLQDHINLLNKMEAVAKISVPENLKSKKAAAKWAIEHLKTTGYAIERQGFGRIYFDSDDIDYGMKYADTPAEKAAILALPKVLKRGIEVGEHGNHKGRSKHTITFAAPVELNGIRGIMAVVVNRRGNHYYTHRIVTPDGKVFRFSNEKKDATRELSQGVTFSGSLAETTSAASETSIADSDKYVKQKFSFADDVEDLDAGYARHMQQEDTPEGLAPDDDQVEDYNALARAEKERRAEAAPINRLKSRIKASEKEIQVQTEAKNALKTAGLLTNELKDQINKKIELVRETLKIDKAALKRKEQSFEQQKKEERKKQTEEKIKLQKAQIAQKELAEDLINLFSVKKGVRLDMREMINEFSDELIRSGRLTDDKRQELFRILYENGEDIIEADGYYRDIRMALTGYRIYVSEDVRAEFGDDWESFRKSAWGNRIYLTNDQNDMGIDSVTQEMAEIFGGRFDGEEDLKTQLETILELSEEGKDENVTLAEMMRRNKNEYGWSVEEQMDDLERKVDRMLETFAEKASIEIRLRQKNIAQLVKEREGFRKSLEERQQRKMENQARNNVMRSIEKLSRMKRKASPEFRKMIDEALKDIDTVARSISPRGLEDLQELERLYLEQKEAQGSDFLSSPYVEARLDRLHKKQIDDMSIEEVRELGRLVCSITNAIQNSNKLLADAKKESIHQAAKEVNAEVTASKGSKGGKGREFFLNHIDGKRFFGQISGWVGGRMEALGQALSNGQERMMHYQMNATRIVDPFLENKDNRAWLETAAGKKAEWITIKIPDGFKITENGVSITLSEIEITPMMRVSLLLHSMNEDNLRHIKGGGIRIPDKTQYIKGNMKEAYARGKLVKMEPSTVRALVKECTAQEHAFAKVLERYFNQYSKNAINEVSMVLDGFERAGGEHYFHIKTDPAFLAKQNDTIKRDLSVLSTGSIVNERVHASNPIVLQDATDAFMEHVESISKYYSFAVPLRDLNAVLSHTFHQEDNAFSGSVMDTIKRKWGSSAEEYIDKLMADLQLPERNSDLLSGLLAKIRGNYAKAVISANVSSLLKQITSYPVAVPYLKTDALVHGLFAGSMKGDVKTLEKYSAVYWYRNQGNATMELSDVMKQREFGDALPWVFNATQKMDSAVTRRLLAACEYRVQKDMKLSPGSQSDIEAGTDRYWMEVAKLFNEVVLKTQSNSTMMERPQITRANATNVSRFLTMFRTDSFQQLNMLVEAKGRLGAAKKAFDSDASNANRKTLDEAKGFMARTVAGTMLGQVVVAAITNLLKLARFDDEDYRDEEGNFDWGKFLGSLGLDVVEGYAGFLVGVDTLYSAAYVFVDKVLGGDSKWYDIEVNALASFNDLVSAVVNLGDVLGKGSLWEGRAAIKEAAMAASRVFGIPAQNIEKYLLMAVRWISPEWAELHDNFWEETTKDSLSKESKHTVGAAIGVLIDNRMDGISDDDKEEIARLYMAGGKGAVPSGIPISIGYTDEDGEEIEVKLSVADRKKYRKVWNETVSSALPELLASEDYDNADDEGKAELIDKLYKYANDVVKHAIVPEKEMDKWVQQGQNAVDEGIPLAEYICFRTDLSGINGKDKNGESVDGLAAQRKMELLESMGWTDHQEENIYLDILASESNAKTEALLREAGLSWDQTNDLLVMTGKKWDKMKAITDMNVSEAVKAKAMEVYASEKEKSLIQVGLKFGVKMDWYTEVKMNADTNGSGNVDSEEALIYIRDVMSLWGQEGAYLWQMVTDCKSENPFGDYFGEEFWWEVHKNDPIEED